MRFLIDVNLSPRWVALLAPAGHTAVRWTDVGANTASDEEIMRYAAQLEYTVLTHDQDFSTLPSAEKANPAWCCSGCRLYAWIKLGRACSGR